MFPHSSAVWWSPAGLHSAEEGSGKGVLNAHLDSKKALFWTLGALCQVLGAMGQKCSQSHCMRMGSKEGKAVFPKPVGLRNTELVGIPEGSSPELSLDPCPMLGGSRQQDLSRRGVKMGRQGATLSQQRHFWDFPMCWSPQKIPFPVVEQHNLQYQRVLLWGRDICGQKCVCRNCTMMCLTLWMCPGVLQVCAPMLQGDIQGPFGDIDPRLAHRPFLSQGSY